MKKITMLRTWGSCPLRYRSLLLSLCALGGAAFAYDPPVYPQLPTERGYGMVDAFISGNNANDDAGIFRSDWEFRSNQSGHSHRLGQTINNVLIEFSTKPAGFQYGFVPDEVWGTECYGNSTKVKVGGFEPGREYIFQHYIAETWQTQDNNNRRYYVKVNGSYIGPNKDYNDDPLTPSQNVRTPYVSEGFVTADAEGFLEMSFEGVNDNATYGGFSVWGTSAPRWTDPAIVGDGSDVKMTWTDPYDVLRYYVYSADSADGPWTEVEVMKPGITSYTIPSAYNPMVEKYWRVVASNGVGTVTCQAKLGDASAVIWTDLATAGETVASDATANYRVATDAVGALNSLGDVVTEAAMYVNDFVAGHTLAIGDGETFKVGTLGINSSAGDMSIGNMGGRGVVSPLNGTLTLDVKDAGAILFLNSFAAKTADNNQIVKFGEGAAKLVGGTDMKTISIGAGTVEMPNDADATLAQTLSGAGAFVKSGSGTLTIDNENPNFAGTFEVKEGTLLIGRTDAYKSFGDGAATIKVDSGATLDVGMPGAGGNAVGLRATKIVFEGTGDNGKGALANTSTTSQYNALVCGEMSGDATVNALGRFDFRNTVNGAYFNMNGYVLTKKGGSEFLLTSVPVYAGGDSAKMRVEEGTLGVEVATTLNGNGSFELFNGSTFSFYNLNGAITWPFYVDATGGRFLYRAGNTTQNLVTGQINLDVGTLKVGAGNGVTSVLPAKITGTGRLMGADGDDSGIVRISNAENDYTGGTEANKGTILFETAAALPGYNQPGTVTVSGTGKLGVKLGEGGWTEAEVADLLASATAPDDGKGSITIDTNGIDAESGEGDVVKAIGIGKTGEGSFIDKMAYLAGGGIYADQGTLVISNNSENTMSGLQVIKSGRVEIYDSKIDFGNNNLNIGNVRSDGNIPSVLVGKGALIKSYMAPAQNGSPALSIGSTDVGGGILEVQDGGIVSNKLFMCNNQFSQSAVLQSGGEIVNWGGHSSDTVLANAQYTWGYWEVAGTGSTAFMGYSQLAKHPNGYSTLAIRDEGSVLVTNALYGALVMSRGGHGAIDQSGGTFETVGGFDMGEANDWDGKNGTAVYEMRGGSANIGAGVRVADRADFIGQVNFIGGELAANSLYKGNKENAKAYATFNGGTFKAKQAGAKLFGDAAESKLDGVYVYENGAQFDTAGNSVSLGQTLRAPTGLGVKAIRWTHADAAKLAWKGTELMGPPMVVIEGDGAGATAVVDFDTATRKVKGIIVTSPGWGYTEKPTVKLIGGGLKIDNNTQFYEIAATAITMGESSSGPIVKKGEGTLTLEGNNAVAGAEVRGGELSIPAGSSIQPGPLTLAGGAFSAPAYTATELVVNGEADDVSTLDTVLTIGGSRPEARSPGLYTTFKNGDYDTALTATAENAVGTVCELEYVDTVATEGVEVFPGFVNTSLGCAYDGYIWNRTDETATWTFAEFFDDNVYLTIDDTVVLNNTQWDAATLSTVEVQPGAHRFHLVVYQGGGGSGPSGSTLEGNAWIKGSGFGVCVDFQGRGEANIEYFQKLADPGDGSLFTLHEDEPIVQDFAPEAVVHVNGGTLKIASSQIGLAGGFVANGTYRNAACPRTGVYPNLNYANDKYGETDELYGHTNSNIDYVFEGYIWNHGENDVVWTFVENFDDNVYLTIDGVAVLDNGVWSEPTKANVTLAPGPHSIRIGLHQGTGGSGPSGQGWLNVNIGIGIDFQGRDAEEPSNYVPLTATAHGGELPLLTTGSRLPNAQAIPSSVSLAISNDAKIDLDGGTLAVSGGLYSAQSAVMNGKLSVSGDWTMDFADVVAGNSLTADKLDLSGAHIVFTGDASLLDKSKRYYVIADSADQIAGQPLSFEGTPKRWQVKVRDDKLLLLPPPKALVLIFK